MSTISALIGYPVKHSVSNYLFSLLANYAGIDDYHHLKIATESREIKKKIDSLVNIECIGFNITMPYKLRVMDIVSEIDDSALNSGAINCIKIKNKKMIGYNTDGVAAWQAISRNLKKPKIGETVLIIGSGGTARSIIEKTLEFGLKTCVLYRNDDEALSLKSFFSNRSMFSIEKLNDKILFDKLNEIDFLINTTPVGMKPDIVNSLVSSEIWNKLSKKRNLQTLYVLDVILNPHKTKLLKDAERYGANTTSGLWMMIYQGLEAFKIWTEFDLLNSIDLMSVFKRLKNFAK